MKTYVINLERSRERREHQEAQLSRLGIEHEFVSAVDGRELDEGAYPHGMPPNIAGCVLSHVETYQRILQDGADAAFVVEDDAVLPDYTRELLQSIEPHLDRPEAVMLHYRRVHRIDTCPLSRQGELPLHGGSRLLYPVTPDFLSGTTAYVITREGCERLSEWMVPVRTWPDDWRAYVREGALERVRCVYPRAVEVETDFKSTMDYATGLAARVVPARVRAWRRARIERSLSRFPIVTDPPRLPDAQWPPAARS